MLTFFNTSLTGGRRSEGATDQVGDVISFCCLCELSISSRSDLSEARAEIDRLAAEIATLQPQLEKAQREASELLVRCDNHRPDCKCLRQRIL